LNYGSIIYGTAKTKILALLDPIHNQEIRLASGPFRTSLVISILCNAREPPLQIHNINTMKYMIKTSNQPKYISSSKFHKHFQNTKTNTPTTVYIFALNSTKLWTSYTMTTRFFIQTYLKMKKKQVSQ